jgi:hypothetical protein
MNEYLVFVFGLLHVVSYGLVARRANSRINDSSERISIYFVGPRSLANLWRLLFGMSFIRSGDKMLIVAGVVHIFTTTVFVVLLARLLFQGLG